MRIKVFIKLLVILIFLKLSAFAQLDSISISGTVDTNLTRTFNSNELIIKYNSTTNPYSSGDEKFIVPISKSGTFHIKFAPTSKYSYLSFEIMNNGKNKYQSGVVYNICEFSRQNTYFKEVYLFEGGDNIELRISNNGILYFQGIGSEKLNCQSQIYLIEPKNFGMQLRTIELSNHRDYDKKLSLEDKFVRLTIKMRLELILTFKGVLTPDIYNMLCLDAISSAQYPFISKLFLICYNPDPAIGISSLKQYLENSQKVDVEYRLDSTYMAESAYYAETVFQKELNYSRIYSKSKSYRYGDSFREIYSRLIDKYKGDLRDKLIYIAFESLSVHFADETKKMVDQAIKLMNNNQYKVLLSAWKSKQTAIFPFELQDVNGIIHKPTEFGGKVAIIDFWYSGCPNCVALNKKMIPIVKRFKNNKKVIFVNICIDADKKTWRESINSGLYTSPETLNLYTNGMGTNHELLRTYRIISFPRQIIIGKTGQIISSGPPRVDLTKNGDMITTSTSKSKAEENSIEFIKILEKNL